MTCAKFIGYKIVPKNIFLGAIIKYITNRGAMSRNHDDLVSVLINNTVRKQVTFLNSLEMDIYERTWLNIQMTLTKITFCYC